MRIIFLVNLIILFNINLFALNPNTNINNYTYKNWTTSEGLPQNWVYSIVQTEQGFIWASTQAGLVKFDGHTITVFHANLNEVPNDVFSPILIDSKGTLWVGSTGSGLFCFENNSFFHNNISKKLPGNIIRDISEDKLGNLWVGTYTEGVVKINNGNVKVFNKDNGLISNVVRVIYPDSKNRIWIGTSEGLGLIENGKLKNFTVKEGLNSNEIKDVIEYENKEILVATTRGISIFKNGKFIDFSNKLNLKESHVLSLTYDSEKTLWVGTLKGVFRLVNGTFQKSEFLSDQSVRAIVEGVDGNFYIATSSLGIVCVSEEKQIKNITKKDGLITNDIWSVLKRKNGDLWVAAEGGGLSILSKNGNKYFNEKNGFASDVALCIFEDSRGFVWVGTESALYKFKDKKIIYKYTKENGLPSNTVISIFEDSKKRLWFGTEGGGVAVLNNGKFKILNESDGLVNNLISAVCEKQNGNVLLGSFVGFCEINKDFKVVNINKKLAITCLYKDSDGVIWFGTNGKGMGYFTENNFRIFSEKDGLFSNGIWSIIEDKNRNLWMTSNKGPFVVSLKSFKLYEKGKVSLIDTTYFSKEDGMTNSECNGGVQPSSMVDKSGNLYIPTMGGIVKINTNKFNSATKDFPILIDKVKVGEKVIYNCNELTLQPDEEEFEIYFSKPEFVHPEKIRFRWKINVISKDWNSPSNSRRAQYINLNPGEYTFKVISNNKKGIWNYNGATLKINVLPYFYETKIFYLLIVVSVFSLFYVFYKLRVRKIINEEIRLMKLVEERTESLKEEQQKTEKQSKKMRKLNKKLIKINKELKQTNKLKSDILGIVAHDLKNPLQGIIGNSDILQRRIEKPENKKKVENIIVSANRMVHLINELLYSAKLDAGKLELNKSELNIVNLLKEVIRENSDLAEQKSQKIEFICKLKEINLKVDGEKIKRIFENLLSNSIKYSPYESKIEVEVKEGGKYFSFLFKDQGPGISEIDKKKLFKRFTKLSAKPTGGEKATGLGLSIAKELVEMHKGKISVETPETGGSIFKVKLLKK